MNKVLKHWRNFQDEIGEPPYNYYFLQNLSESEYPKYLSKLYKMKTGERLNLKHPKTFNEKIQWIKLYGITSLMRECTDKVKVRDYVKERIGEEYLKPVLQIIPNESKETMRCHCEQVNNNLGLARQSGDISNDIPDCHGTQNVVAPRNDREPNDVSTYFDKIDFDKLPSSFVIKTNHGCKWQYIIKNKEEYKKNKRLFEETKKQMTGWLEQEYWIWGGFELQYRNIEPKIIIEPLLNGAVDFELYYFNSNLKILRKIYNNGTDKISVYDEKFNNINLKFMPKDILVNEPIDEMLIKAISLSFELAKDFKFIRIDWLNYENRLYFNEMTFTPFSGFCRFDKNWNKILGGFLNGF